jgi:hypothetical protein
MSLSKSKPNSKRKLPDHTSPGALAVSDGGKRVGSIVRQGPQQVPEYLAFDADGKCLGTFDSTIEAAQKIIGKPWRFW